MKTVYIAGAYRGKNAWEVELNVRKAELLALLVAENGAAYICPHTNARFFDGTINQSYWILMTLELMSRCDAVLVVPGYEDSVGTRGEIARAESIGMPVFYDLSKCVEWIYKSDVSSGK